DFGVPISDGSLVLMVSFAGVSLAMVSVSGKSIDWVAPLARTVMVCEPGLASFGTSTRSCRLTLSFMPGMAAATGWPPPKISAFQPLGAPLTVSASDSGGKPAFCNLKRTLAISPGRTACDGYSVNSHNPLTAGGAGGSAAKTWTAVKVEATRSEEHTSE